MLAHSTAAQAQQSAQPAPALPEVTVETPKPQVKAAPPKAAPKAAATKRRAQQARRAPQPTPVPAPVVESAPPAVVEAPAPAQIEGGQVRPGRSASQVSDTPLATQTTGEGIRRNEIGSISDLGNTTEPGVDYSKSTDGPVIRGMDGPRVSTIVDGIPLPYLENDVRASTSSINAPTNANGGGAAFDFFAISALDVVRGADSSRIGSGVLGGAIVIRTLEPEDIITDGRSWGGLAKIGYDGRDNSIGGGLAVAATSGGTSALLLGSYKKGHETDNKGTNGSYGATRTEPNPLDYDQDNLLFKLRQTTIDGHRFGITAERYRRDADGDLMTNWNRSTAASGYDPYNFFGHDDVERKRTSFDYSYVAPVPGSLVESAFATAYWMNLAKDSGADGTQRNGTYYLRDVAFEHETLGFVGGMRGNFWTGGLKHKWQTGIDLSDFTVTQFTTVLPPTMFGNSQADIPKIDGKKFGIYIDDRISLGDSRFALTPGLRFDWHEYAPKETAEYDDNTGSGVFPLPDKNTGSRVTPKVLATYQVADKVELFAQWSAAYRAPTVSELYINFTNPVTGYAQIGNPDLKPETGHGVEVGTNFGDQHFGGRITAFHNWYKNFITSTDLMPDPNYPELPFGVSRYVNLDEVELSGIEVKAHKRFYNGFKLHGGLAYTYGKDGDGNLLPTVAPFKAIVGIGYDRETWGVDLTGIFVGKYRDDYADPTRVDTTFDAPSYAIANLSTWWEPTFVNGMRIQAGVKNLFDETYYDALALRNVNLSAASSQPLEFYSSPGRAFVLSVTQKF